MTGSNEQVEQWYLRRKAYLEDTASVRYDKDIDERRPRVQHEMIQLLNSFLDGTITLKEFNTAFQQKTHDAWNVFHLRGMSGGLFLNKLVKYVPSEDTFGHLFRLIVRVPEDTRDGQQRMQAFLRFLEGLIASRQITRAQLQPARVPFFLSAWWHIQDSERWPVFYLDVRQALVTEDGRSIGSQNPVDDYFAFRTRFLSLAQTLGVSSWELEHVSSWYARRNSNSNGAGNEKASAGAKRDSHGDSPQKQACLLAVRAEAKQRSASVTEGEESISHKEEYTISCRTHLQWVLAKLGHKVGCRVWIAVKDHGKVCQNEQLGHFSLPSLPILVDSAFQKIISQIDVLWLLNDDIAAAFEIEQAHTDVTTSLLRLYDLGMLFPQHKVQLCVVAPKSRFEKVQFELSRPTFDGHDMRKHCALISEELLLQQEEHILRWASSPSVIQDLIGHVGDGKEACSSEHHALTEARSR